MVVIRIEAANKVIAEAGAVFGVVPEYFESITIKPVQSIFCTKPEKSLAVLQTAKHGIIREPVLHLVVTKIIRLAGGAGRKEKQNGKYKTIMDQSDRIGFGL